ncbi:hypothetical protein ACWEWX_53510, partial [Streptomyces asiaticus]
MADKRPGEASTRPAWRGSAADPAARPPAPSLATRNRAREWATRAPLLPALIFLIVVTQLPFV